MNSSTMSYDTRYRELYDFKFWTLFLVLSLLYVVLTYFTNNYVYTSGFYETLLHGAIDEERIHHTIEVRQKFLWVSYLTQPLLLLLRCLLFAAAIFTGTLLSEAKISFRNCLKIVLIAELVTFFSAVVKAASYLIFPSLSPKNFQYFYPLSMLQLLDVSRIEKYLLYPLSLVSLFELAYFLLLIMGVRALSGRRAPAALKLVATTYGMLLLVWVLVVVFISLQFN